MEEYMQKALTDDILKEATKRYDFSLDNLKYIGGFENFVYEYQKDSTPFILRFVHSGHRTFDMVLAEIEFIDYLAHNKASVSTVIHSVNDLITEQIPIDEGTYFSVTSFSKAPGTYVREEEKTAELFYMLGKDIGRLHYLTKEYQPKHKRIHWYEENYMDMGHRSLQEEDRFFLDEYSDLMAKIRALPTDKDHYGLIHTDLHFGNMYYDQTKLTFFDFDDSSYKHFLSDIAIVIYYDMIRTNPTKEELNERARFILQNLLAGYQTENTIDMDLLRYINEFLYLRSLVLYIVLVAAGMQTTEDPRRLAFLNLIRKKAVERSMDLDLEYVLKDL